LNIKFKMCQKLFINSLGPHTIVAFQFFQWILAYSVAIEKLTLNNQKTIIPRNFCYKSPTAR